MKKEEEVIKRLKQYRLNIETAKTGKLENSQNFIRGAMRELNWILDERADEGMVHKAKIDK